MIAASSPKLWTPWDSAKRKWGDFLASFQQGKLQRSPGGKLKRNGIGKLVRNSSTSATCCCGVEDPIYCVTTCCDNACEGVGITGVAQGDVFSYLGVCSYAGVAVTAGDVGEIITAGDVTPLGDSCLSCPPTLTGCCGIEIGEDCVVSYPLTSVDVTFAGITACCWYGSLAGGGFRAHKLTSFTGINRSFSCPKTYEDSTKCGYVVSESVSLSADETEYAGNSCSDPVASTTTISITALDVEIVIYKSPRLIQVFYDFLAVGSRVYSAHVFEGGYLVTSPEWECTNDTFSNDIACWDGIVPTPATAAGSSFTGGTAAIVLNYV